MIRLRILTGVQRDSYLNVGRSVQTRALTNTWPKRALVTTARYAPNAPKPKVAAAFNALTGNLNSIKPEIKARAGAPVAIDSGGSTCWRAVLLMPATIMDLSERGGGDSGVKPSKII